jgi:hypothetical protein
MRSLCLCALALANCLLFAEQKSTPLTHRQLCEKYQDAVVRIEAGGRSRGSGFLVSADGYILTSSHLIRGENGNYFSVISVWLPDGKPELAQAAVPLSLDNVGQDFAVLKVDAKSLLPFLELGATNDANVGADATIIGFPFSALTEQGENVKQRFCLSASFAATTIETVHVQGTNIIQGKTIPVQKDVKVDVIYFQGPSVKGISGSPIIAQDTGHVVGIVSAKLTGIGKALTELKQQTAAGVGGGIIISGLEPGKAVNQILTVLDDQLANDLGAATGIDDPKYALTRVQQKSK